MSFYINNNNPNRPGPICGNPTQGICEKVLIEVTKVFDACVSQTTEQNVSITVTNFTPATPTLPLTYISADTDPTNPAVLSNVIITRLDNRPNFANITGTLTIPLVVSYRDANGVLGTGTSTITRTISTVLFVPQPSLTPISVKATAVYASTIGTFTAPNIFVINGCLDVIVKVVAEVDILVPSYGYPYIPPCQNLPQNECPGLEDLPLYPTALNPNSCNR